MKSKLLLVMCTIMTCMLAQRSDAQSTRYLDSIFAAYTLDSVTYSTVTGFKMDIYQPAGDVATNRPVVVLAHEGTFYAGDRESDPTVVGLCQDLAHKGYVTVSIDYTLAASPVDLFDTGTAATEVFKAIADARAAVRYLYADAYGANLYKIDTSNVFIGGNSAGAVLGMHYAYVTDTSQLDVNHFFKSAVDSIGGTLQGNHGNPGYNSNVKGVISCAGGLNQTAWLAYCSLPIVYAQGSADQVVPYTCAEPFISGFNVPLQLCGLGSLQANVNGNTPYSSSLVFPGLGHVPWDASQPLFNQVDTLVTGFLYKEVTNAVPSTCGAPPAGIRNISTANISVYPNPATDLVNIHSSEYISAISVSDEMGRVVAQASNIHNLEYQMNTSGISTGVYIVRIYNEQEQTPAVRKITIE
jgi:para-nitrobenzyl esterase